MDEMSAGEVLNGASCMLNDKHDCNGKPSNYIYCNEAFCSLESIMALRNAYIVLRDRYNKLKLENLKLMKRLKKCKETTPTENLFDSCSSPNDPPRSVIHDAEVQPLSIACELERLRERLCSASVEIRDHIDADLKDLMTSIIPKLEDLNRQFLRFSDAHQNSPALANFHDMHITSMDNGGHLSCEAMLDDRRRNFHTQDTPVVGDLVSSWDYEDSLNSNTVALINSLKDVLASISTQSSDLGTARRLLKHQNEKLLQMKIKVIPRPSSPEPAFARDSPDISGWSIIQGHNKQIYNFDINYPEI